MARSRPPAPLHICEISGQSGSLSFQSQFEIKRPLGAPSSERAARRRDSTCANPKHRMVLKLGRERKRLGPERNTDDLCAADANMRHAVTKRRAMRGIFQGLSRSLAAASLLSRGVSPQNFRKQRLK